MRRSHPRDDTPSRESNLHRDISMRDLVSMRQVALHTAGIWRISCNKGLIAVIAFADNAEPCIPILPLRNDTAWDMLGSNSQQLT